MNRFSFKVVIAATIMLGLAACDGPSPQADRGTPAVTPLPSPSAADSAPKAGAPQTKLAADMALSDKVKQAVQEPGRSRVEVAADNGVVTLYGTVEKPADKHRIALAAMEIEGVRSVVNNLVVMSTS